MRSHWIQDLPIDRKLMVITMLTVATALVVAGCSFVAADSVALWRSTKEELRTLAEVLAINSVSAITFEDEEIAKETLASLRAKPRIVGGCLYADDARLLARYTRSGAAPRCPAVVSGVSEPHASQGELVVLHPVTFQGERLGAVYLRSDLSAFSDRVGFYAVGAALAAGFAILIAGMLSSRLKNLVTLPLLRLVSATRAISSSKDYAMRVAETSRDEIGQLIQGFNGMLDQIQLRDGELRTAHSQLEVRVLERTAQLRQEVEVRKQAEQAAAARAEELARSNEELERYAFIASHDLKEPLRAVAGFAQLLGRRYRGKLDDKADEYIRHMIEGSERMRSLLQDLLTYSRVGSRSESFQRVPLEQPLKDAISNLSVLIGDTGAELEIGPLPEVRGDPTQLLQLFQNLLGNALKFRRAGARPRVAIGARRVGGTWEIRIRDNGIGIEPEYRDRIFVIFQRLHTRGEYEGTGIGLAVCEKIVRRHGGRIRVESNPDGGSIFVFTLPDPATPGIA